MATTAPRRTTVKIAAGVIVLGGGFVVFLLSAIAGILGNAERPSNSFAASDAALADIPEDYLRSAYPVGSVWRHAARRVIWS